MVLRMHRFFVKTCQAESTLKKIQAETSGASGVSQSEAKLRGNVVRTLAGRLQDKSVAFRRTQKDFLARRSEQKVWEAESIVDEVAYLSIVIFVMNFKFLSQIVRLEVFALTRL